MIVYQKLVHHGCVPRKMVQYCSIPENGTAWQRTRKKGVQDDSVPENRYSIIVYQKWWDNDLENIVAMAVYQKNGAA